MDEMIINASFSDLFFNWEGHDRDPDMNLGQIAEAFVSETQGVVDHGHRDAEWYVLDFRRRE